MNEYEYYDPGLLNDFGGGNIEWWQDYIRCEVEACNIYWQDIVTDLEIRIDELEADLEEANSQGGKR